MNHAAPSPPAPPDGDSLDILYLRRTAAGDRAAFDAFVRRHAPVVFRFSNGITQDRTLAEDVVQQTFLNAFRTAGGFRAESSARSWLLTIARNTAYRLCKLRHREEPVEQPLDALGQDAGWSADNPETIALLAERHDLLQQALRKLAPADREILILRDIEQISGAEAAKALGLQLPAMKSRLHRARLRLACALRTLEEADGD
ncbi:MAG: sigma-70 family RNA polymerase sigma factor [Myxococcota bacterium]